MQLTTLLAILPLVAAGSVKRSEPAPVLYPRSAEVKIIPDKYVVKFKKDSALSAFEDTLSILTSKPEHVYKHVFNGFAGEIDEETLNALRDHPDVSLPYSTSRPYGNERKHADTGGRNLSG